MKGVEQKDVVRDLEQSSRPLRMRFYPPREATSAAVAKVEDGAIDGMSTSELKALAKELRRSSLDAQLEIVELKVRKQYSDSEDSEGEKEPEDNVLERDGRVSVVLEGEEDEEGEDDSPVLIDAAGIVTAVFKAPGPVGIRWIEAQVPGVAVIKDTKPGSHASRVPSLKPGEFLSSS